MHALDAGPGQRPSLDDAPCISSQLRVPLPGDATPCLAARGALAPLMSAVSSVDILPVDWKPVPLFEQLCKEKRKNLVSSHGSSATFCTLPLALTLGV